MRLELSYFIYQIKIALHSTAWVCVKENLLEIKAVNRLSNNLFRFCANLLKDLLCDFIRLIVDNNLFTANWVNYRNGNDFRSRYLFLFYPLDLWMNQEIFASFCIAIILAFKFIKSKSHLHIFKGWGCIL